MENKKRNIVMPKDYNDYELLSANGGSLAIAKVKEDLIHVVIPYFDEEMTISQYMAYRKEDKNMYYDNARYKVVSDRFYIAGGTNTAGQKSLSLFDGHIFKWGEVGQKHLEEYKGYLTDAGVSDTLVSALGKDWNTVEKELIIGELEKYFGDEVAKLLLLNLE